MEATPQAEFDQTAALRRLFADRGEHWTIAIDQGHDVSLIEESLAATPHERLRRHQRFLDMALRLEGATRGPSAAN